MKEIFDKDGKPLSQEDAKDYLNDVLDCGVPMSKQSARWLWEKWGERLGIAEIYPELATKKND